jgi:hypothetical protein
MKIDSDRIEAGAQETCSAVPAIRELSFIVLIFVGRARRPLWERGAHLRRTLPKRTQSRCSWSCRAADAGRSELPKTHLGFRAGSWKSDPHGNTLADLNKSDSKLIHVSDALGYFVAREVSDAAGQRRDRWTGDRLTAMRDWNDLTNQPRSTFIKPMPGCEEICWRRGRSLRRTSLGAFLPGRFYVSFSARMRASLGSWYFFSH